MCSCNINVTVNVPHTISPLTGFALSGDDLSVVKLSTNAGWHEFKYDRTVDFEQWLKAQLEEVTFITSATSLVCGLSFPIALDAIDCFEIHGSNTSVFYKGGEQESFPTASFDFAFNNLTDQQIGSVAREVAHARETILE